MPVFNVQGSKLHVVFQDFLIPMYKVNMKVLPFTFYGPFSREECTAMEPTDRILVHENTKFAVQDKIEIRNSIDQTIFGTVYQFHTSDENIIYVPCWMYYSMDVHDNVSITNLCYGTCTKIILRPHHTSFFHVQDLPMKFASTLNNYSILAKDRKILLDIDGPQYFTIEMIYPTKYTYVYIRNNQDIEIEFVHSLEKSGMPSFVPFLYNAKKTYPPIHAFAGNSYKINSTIQTTYTKEDIVNVYRKMYDKH